MAEIADRSLLLSPEPYTWGMLAETRAEVGVCICICIGIGNCGGRPEGAECALSGVGKPSNPGGLGFALADRAAARCGSEAETATEAAAVTGDDSRNRLIAEGGAERPGGGAKPGGAMNAGAMNAGAATELTAEAD